MSRTLASATPGAGIVPKCDEDGKIPVGFFPDSTRSLFSGLMSAKPTQSLTGFSNWVNQGSATVEDSMAGLTIYCPSNGSADAQRGLIKTAPTAPYTVTALLGITSWTATLTAFALGWRDTATGKLQIANFAQTTSAGYHLVVQTWSSPTAYIASQADVTYMMCPYLWVQLADDETNVTVSFSYDGKHFVEAYTVAKSSGYLGSSGYNQIGLFVNPYNYLEYATLMSYAEA